MAHSEAFERSLADLSTRLSGVRPEQLDAEIESTFERLVDLLGTDRCTLLELLPDEGAMAITHSWARPGVTPAATAIRVRPSFPWYHARLRRGEVLRFERLPDELPAEAEAERRYVVSLPMLSHLAIPLRVGGRWVCALLTATAREHRSWTDRDVARLRIIGQILANAVQRRTIESELRESLDTVRSLQRRLEAENAYLRESIDLDANFDQITGRSLLLRAVLEQAAQVAPTSTAVLLLGETGTGKDLVARAIHARSRRSERALIRVNCAALPASLVESELFGHEKGAFTGAISTKPGRFELADGGTIFLDEIGEMPLEAQAKLLRVLQDGELERVGATRSRKVDVRVVAATNRDLERAMAEGRFREDLYYRLSVFPLRLPPLRERCDDIPLLVWELIHRRQDELERRIDTVPDGVMHALIQHPWPGNVRELANVVERALILSRGPTLTLDALPAPRATSGAAPDRLDSVERRHLQQVLARCEWKINGRGNAADVLGMQPSTLRSRLKKLGVSRPEKTALA